MDKGLTPNNHKGVMWNESYDRKEKETTYILHMNVESERHTGEEVEDGQHTASEIGKSEDGISSTKISGPGIKVDKNEGNQEEKHAHRKEGS